MAIDSFKKRYFFKLLTNLLNFFISFLTAGIIPRALGVNNYGNYTYVTNIFNQLISFLEFRTSTYYFIKLSQNHDNRKITLFYLSYTLLLLCALTIISIIVIYIRPLNHFVFSENSFGNTIVFFLFLITFFIWLTEIISSALDALGYTVYLEKIRMINKIVSALCILGLFYLKNLNIYTLISIQFLLTISLIVLLTRYLKNNYRFDNERLNRNDFSTNFNAFYKYSHPLFGYLILQFIGSVFDRWYLQHEGGSFQQGLYSFAYTLMNFCYLFINAIQPLIMREFSIAAGSKDKEKMTALFLKFNSILFAITAYFCAFIFVEASNIVELFGGNDYSHSANILQILMLYPLISSLSLLNSAILYTTEKTKLFLKLSLIFTPVGILLTYILLNKNWGFSMGSNGLAIKNVLGDFISVVIILFINSKYLNFGYIKTLLHFLFFGTFIAIAYLSHFIIGIIHTKLFATIFISGIMYSSIILVLFFSFPQLIGLSTDIRTMAKNKIHEYYNKWISPSKTN